MQKSYLWKLRLGELIFAYIVHVNWKHWKPFQDIVCVLDRPYAKDKWFMPERSYWVSHHSITEQKKSYYPQGNHHASHS